MRQLASYSLETNITGQTNREGLVARIEQWLNEKGQVATEGVLTLKDGRVAQIQRSNTQCSHGTIDRVSLTEPIENGSFITSIEVGSAANVLALSVQLAAGSDNLSPQWLDVRRPKVVLRAFELTNLWRYGGSDLAIAPIRFSCSDGGDAFIQLVWNIQRTIPVVAVSTDGGLDLHPGIAEDLASDLAGLAVVAKLDEPASWRLTNRKNKTWSCYGGAIRLYWPAIDPQSSPFDHHKLWTPRALLLGVSDTDEAARRIRRYLRRDIFSQSAFAVRPHAIFNEIRRIHRQEELASIRATATSEADYRELAEKFYAQLLETQNANAKLIEENSLLNAQVANLNLTIQAMQVPGEPGDAELRPAIEAPPTTVEDAVLTASEKFSETLVFGKSAYEGSSTVVENAGPPDKILAYLAALHEMTLARRQGPLGTSTVKWLKQKGVVCSGESYTIANSKDGKAARTWDDGNGGFRQFELHLKPKEATSPDQCVRIYFDYDDGLAKTIIGWVGRHPDT